MYIFPYIRYFSFSELFQWCSGTSEEFNPEVKTVIGEIYDALNSDLAWSLSDIDHFTFDKAEADVPALQDNQRREITPNIGTNNYVQNSSVLKDKPNTETVPVSDMQLQRLSRTINAGNIHSPGSKQTEMKEKEVYQRQAVKPYFVSKENKNLSVSFQSRAKTNKNFIFSKSQNLKTGVFYQNGIADLSRPKMKSNETVEYKERSAKLKNVEGTDIVDVLDLAGNTHAPTVVNAVAESNGESNGEDVSQNRQDIDVNADDTETDIEHLRRINKDLKNVKMCKVCKDGDANMLFLPCAHLSCCSLCSLALLKCPQCKGVKRGVIPVSFH